MRVATSLGLEDVCVRRWPLNDKDSSQIQVWDPLPKIVAVRFEYWSFSLRARNCGVIASR